MFATASLSDWFDFFVAQVGAAAVLAGLVFVGVSINLARVMAMPALPGRALEAMLALAAVLIGASLCLVPGQAVRVLGIELLALGLLVWATMTAIQRDIARKLDVRYRRVFVPTIIVGQTATLSFVAAGAVVIAGGDTGGIYLLVPACLLSYLTAISEAWVLLVEIHP